MNKRSLIEIRPRSETYRTTATVLTHSTMIPFMGFKRHYDFSCLIYYIYLHVTGQEALNEYLKTKNITIEY